MREETREVKLKEGTRGTKEQSGKRKKDTHPLPVAQWPVAPEAFPSLIGLPMLRTGEAVLMAQESSGF